MDTLSRRTLLSRAGALAALVGIVGLDACTRTGGSSGSSGLAGEGGPFASPTELRSADGRLAVTLVAGQGLVPWGIGKRFATTYNGTTPGPTLRVRPGDTLTVTLRNELDRTTNLHTHGLHVSPDGASDNVFVMVEPGAEHTYVYEIPHDHPSGTFWYHPHHHGLVAAQLSGGMAGVIVVEDEIDDRPSFTATTERVVVLSDPKLGTTAAVLQASGMELMRGRQGDAVLTNGLRSPSATATSGTMERWRLVNASASRYHRLTVSGAPMYLIASDHGRLGAPVAVDELVLTPGQRAEVLVPLGATDRVALRSGRTDLLTLAVTGAAPAAPVPGTLREEPATPTPGRSRSFVLGMGMGMDGGGGGGMMGGGNGAGGGGFTINGRSFDGARIDTEVASGTVEEWTISNSSMMAHPFHLHVWPMKVVSRSDGSAPDPGWRDTVDVPAGQSVVVRIPFADFAGTAVYHCHILDHEDQGMMGVIRVA